MNIEELIKIVQPYTMASPERLRWKAETAERIIREGIPGDFVECGVWNGGSAAIQAYYAIPAGRAVHLFDSWQGMPKPSANDLPSAGGVTSESEIGKCVGSIEKVCEVLHAVGALSAEIAPIFFHKGWFQDTFKQEGTKYSDRTFFAPKIEQIAMLNLDSDWYASELLCWEAWYDKVVPGGYVYIDDFYYWPGCRQAALDFLKSKGEIKVEGFNTIGHSVWIRKGK